MSDVRRAKQKSSSVFSRIFACNNKAGPAGKQYGLVFDDTPAYTACQILQLEYLIGKPSPSEGVSEGFSEGYEMA
jgi:hypothetical protein